MKDDKTEDAKKLIQPASDTDIVFEVLHSLRIDEEEFRYCVISDVPKSKSRPYMTSGGRVYSKANTRSDEQLTGFYLRRLFPEPWKGNIGIGCVFFRPNLRRIDTDNMLKHVFDSANGIIWDDDSQVTAEIARKEYDAANPRTLIVVGHDFRSSFVTRSKRSTQTTYSRKRREKKVGAVERLSR